MRVGGGAERSVSYLCNGLKKHYDVELLTFYNDKKEYSVNVKRHSFNDENKSNLLIKFFRFFVKYPLKLRRFLKKNNYDLVVSNADDANLVSHLTKKVFYKKIKLWSVIRADIQNKVYTKTLFLYKYADKIITICKSLEDKYSKVFPKKYFATLYNALDFEDIKEKLKEKIPKAEEKVYSEKTITAVGRFVPQKNYFFLIEVFKEVLKERIDVKLLIFGTGSQEQEIKNKIKEEKLEQKIILMSVKKNIFPYLKKTSVFVLPTNYEGMPRVLMEALSCGCVSVANNCPTGPAEILDDILTHEFKDQKYKKAKYGYLVPLNDKEEFRKAIIDALKNGKPYKAKAIKRAKDFSLTKVTKDWVEEIERS